MSIWTSDNIELTGFNKEKSSFNQHTSSFNKLVFDLSYAASDEWVKHFDSQKGYSEHNKFDFSASEVSTTGNISVPLHDLQNYIFELKKRFQLTNEYFDNQKKVEQIEKEKYEDVINNLKF